MAKIAAENLRMETVKKLIFRKFGQITDYLNAVRARARVKRYVMSGRKPWTTGYNEYKEKAIGNALGNQDLLKRFMHNRELPTNYGSVSMNELPSVPM